MAVTVRIPTTLRPLSGGASTVDVEAGALADVIKHRRTAGPAPDGDDTPQRVLEEARSGASTPSTARTASE